jgi:proteasome subunit B (beta)-like protein
MTLLIAILCSDGAVVAADRQATHGSLGMMTVGQPVTKIGILGTRVLFASSGHLGMGQQFEAFVGRLSAESYFGQNDYAIAIRRVQDHFRPIAEGAFKTAAAAAQIFGQAAQADCICGSVLATSFKDGAKVIEITPQISVEYLTPELSFLSMGSGKATADPFLGFIKNVFWPDRLPTAREGALAAYWTIKLATELRVSDQTADEVNVAAQAIELRDDDRAFRLPGLPERSGEFGASIKGVSALTGLDLDMLGDDFDPLPLRQTVGSW